GPEDEAHSSSDDISSKAEGNWPWAHLEEPPHIRSDVDCDRHHAREFAKVLTNDLVPNLLKFKASVEVDEAIQEFASNICQQNSLNYSDYEYNLTALNADGIYLATYSALLLALQLMKAGHYDENHDPILIPLSEQQFVTSVQNAGVLVYLSSAWLRELYQCVLATNPIATLKVVENTDGSHCALVDMLYDAGGIGPTQMLSDWQRLQSVVRVQSEPNAKQLAARKLARRLLTCCWDSMVTVLTAGLGEVDDSRTARLMKLSKKTLRVKKKSRCAGEALYALSLEGLHAAATLSNSLNLQHLAGKILNLIATNVCQNSGPKIPASQALSMDVVLSGGLELGSHSADCWLPVFSVCRHVTQLEHDLFSSQNAAMSNASSVANNGKESDSPSKSNSLTDKLNLSAYPIDEDETCVDVYSFLQAPLPNSNANVATILKTYSGNDAVNLSQADTAKMLCALSHQADDLFSNAAERLSLPALLQFLKGLCRASREQLYRNSSSKKGKKSWWLGRPWKVKNDSLPLSLLLHRVGDVTLKVFRGPRPLLHILKVWAITGPHLMDAACHKDRTISKRAIEYIHDIITALLVEQSELPHFHFNEALLKPFENLLSMDSCDVDVQDQIVGCLYEIVEAHRTEIRSGWRPLFGTLRTARNRSVHLSNIIDIFHVFLETDNTLVFANAGLDCILCLLSYLEISGSGGQLGGSTLSSEGTTNDDNNIRSSDFLYDALKFLERCSSILSFMYNMPQCPNLHSTYKIKGITYTHIIDANIPNSMENFTYFGQDYLQSSNEQYMISYRSLHIDKETITKIDELDKPSGVLKVWFLLLDGLTNSLIVCPIAHQSPILQSIFKLFKSLLVNPGIEFGFYCINHLLIPMIQDWLRYVNKAQKNWSLIEKNFKHCCCMTTDLVVEFIEKSQTAGLEDRVVIGSEQQNSYQQSVKKTKLTTIVRPVDNLKYSKMRKMASSQDDQLPPSFSWKKEEETSTATKIPTAAILALKQLLLVLIECSAQSQETIARVGVSCMKHIIFSTGHIFNEDQWMVITSAIHRASTVTMAPLRQLIFAFNENSNSFYGDCANVKVAARRDSTLDELQRVHSLAQQVFLMDNQRDVLSSKINGNVGGVGNGSSGGMSTDDRSYSFLLYPLNCNTNMTQSCSVTGGGISASLQGNGLNLDSYIIRIPYRNLVVGLLASQMLLQLIANILLNGLTNVPNELNSCMYNGGDTSGSGTSKVLFQLGYRSKEVLLRSLKQFLVCSLDFDQRPGLKFLIQKVSNIDNAANLYKQMTSSWIINYMTLVDVYINNIRAYDLNEDDIKYILDSCNHMTAASQQWKKNENFVHYLLALRDLWDLIAEHFIHNLDRNGNDGLPITHIVENKMEKYERFDDKLDCSGGEDDQTSPKGSPKAMSPYHDEAQESEPESPSKSDEESVSVSTIVGGGQLRKNPFNISANQQQHIQHQQQLQHQQQQQQSISPEIEQQRTISIQKDSLCKRSSMKQLIVASMELLKLLPEDQSELLKLLLTPRIREAFRAVQEQGNGLAME
ncbi:brefeldin A-inhibited guanine nucleotide-exchange protein 3-like, partial [Uranotaenia lowii]|uniref:brefeldin A-inhibited guanine nucleotide-exchange protein 3-like n=1 Tax=Uranotaenia lowii TaxID=190385 RepID=UPI002479D99E